MTSTAPLSRRERAALSDLLLEVGPDAPTMCEGWTTRDLLGHLIVRESRPDAALGMAVPALGAHLERTTGAVLDDGYAAAVDKLRAGPPRFSPLAIPAVEQRANAAEFFIHHEDVRRARDGWQPRELSSQDERILFESARAMGRMSALRQDDGLVLVVPDGPRAKVSSARSTGRVKVVTGAPAELLLWASGRESVARVTVD